MVKARNTRNGGRHADKTKGIFFFFGNHLPKAKRHHHEPHAAVFTDLPLTAGPLLGWAALPSYNVP